MINFKSLRPLLFILPLPVFAHTPVPLHNVPAVVMQAVKTRVPGVIITEAAVDIEDNLILFAIVGNSEGEERVFEVTAEGTLIQIHDRAYYEEHLED